MPIFRARVINDNRPATSEYACGVEAVVGAESRMEAIAALRRRGFTSVHRRIVTELEGALPDGDSSLPAVAPGEVWTRSVHVGGGWERR